MKTEDLTGKRFGNFVVQRRLEDHVKPNGKHIPMWECKCDCGNVKKVSGYDLKSGHTKSCGCLQRKRASESHIANMEWKKYGELTVIEKSKSNINGVYWICQCSCGKKVEVLGASLRRGDVKSCGCLRIKKSTKHGLSKSRIRTIWKGMMERCYNKNSCEYHNYGGIGIKVCEEWHNVEVFAEWAHSNGYDGNAERGKCTIDRIDNSKGYSPDNCRWVEQKIQANNKRTNLKLEYNGTTKTLAQWCEELNLDYGKTWYRIRKLNWDVTKAFETK